MGIDEPVDGRSLRRWLTSADKWQSQVTRLGDTGDEARTIADAGRLEPPQLPGHDRSELRPAGESHKFCVRDDAGCARLTGRWRHRHLDELVEHRPRRRPGEQPPPEPDEDIVPATSVLRGDQPFQRCPATFQNEQLRVDGSSFGRHGLTDRGAARQDIADGVQAETDPSEPTNKQQ